MSILKGTIYATVPVATEGVTPVDVLPIIGPTYPAVSVLAEGVIHVDVSLLMCPTFDALSVMTNLLPLSMCP